MPLPNYFQFMEGIIFQQSVQSHTTFLLEILFGFFWFRRPQNSKYSIPIVYLGCLLTYFQGTALGCFS